MKEVCSEESLQVAEVKKHAKSDANCVLIRDNEVLTPKTSPELVVAPGGKMERGETVRDSVVREYREETGIYLKTQR